MSFHVGMLVACIGEFEPRFARFFSRMPRKGEIYVVRGIDHNRSHYHLINGARIGLLLEEIIGQIHPDHKVERSFDARGFRPVKPTSIEVLRRAVERLPEGVEL